MIDALKAAKGHSTSTLWKDVSDNSSYLITSEWSDEQAFTEERVSPIQALRDKPAVASKAPVNLVDLNKKILP